MNEQTQRTIPDHFFTREGAHFIPSAAARGYWRKGTLNGSAAAALAGHALEQAFVDAGFVPVRFCVDLLRMPPDAPLTVATRVLHHSGRVRLVEAEVRAQDEVVTRATCQIVRAGEQPANPVWQSPRWPAPDPDSLPGIRHFGRWEARPIPGDHPRFARATPVGGDPAAGNPPVLGPMAPLSARQTWLRTTGTIVAGEPVTPFMRVVVTADFASPLSHSSAHGIDFVNTDFTVHLHRLPDDEWLGFELTGHSSERGVAVGQATLHDRRGPLGAIAVSAIANARRG